MRGERANEKWRSLRSDGAMSTNSKSSLVSVVCVGVDATIDGSAGGDGGGTADSPGVGCSSSLAASAAWGDSGAEESAAKVVGAGRGCFRGAGAWDDSEERAERTVMTAEGVCAGVSCAWDARLCVAAAVGESGSSCRFSASVACWRESAAKSTVIKRWGRRLLGERKSDEWGAADIN